MPRPTLFDHPKFHRLVYLLKMPEPQVLGLLEYLWRVGYASGDPIIGDELDVEIAAKWWGEPGVFTKAVVKARLVDHREDGQFQIHDLDDHAPEYVKGRRRKEMERKQKKTRHGRDNHDLSQEGHATQPRQSRDSHATVIDISATTSAESDTPAPAPAPNKSSGGAGNGSAISSQSVDLPKKATTGTWLTPFFDLWESVMGGKPNAGLLASVMKPLLDRHGEATALQHLRVYLQAHTGERASFLDLKKFSGTFAQWDGKHKQASGRPKQATDSNGFVN